MTSYVVTFETSTPESRNALVALMKAYKVYCPIHKYCWAIMTDKTATEICDDLKAALRPTDRLFVIRSGTLAAWVNSYGEDNSTWLKKNL